MEQYRAIPAGYMTVGEIAKKMGVTVRTLQYYDREGIFSPSAASEGGRRLYTDKDIVKLHQIQSMKYLGFSLEDIKHRLPAINTPSEVADLLSQQANGIRKEIKALKEVLETIEKLKTEVVQMETVDWRKYANIIVNLQLGNDFYGMIKHIDDDVLDDWGKRMSKDEAKTTIDSISRALDTAIRFLKNGIAPESDQGQALAENFWNETVKTLGDDADWLVKFCEKLNATGELSEKQLLANQFLEPALEIYFTKNNINPFETQEESHD